MDFERNPTDLGRKISRVEKTEPFSQGEEKFQNVNHSPREKRVLIKLDKIKNLGKSLQILRVELFSPREKRSSKM